MFIGFFQPDENCLTEIDLFDYKKKRRGQIVSGKIRWFGNKTGSYNKKPIDLTL